MTKNTGLRKTKNTRKRLALDWTLDDGNSRLEAIEKILWDNPETTLTERNVEMMADYILKPEEKDYEGAYWTFSDLPKNDKQVQHGEGGLDMLIANSHSSAPLNTTHAHRLSRGRVMVMLEGADDEVRSQWFDLWRRIDETEFIVQMVKRRKGEMKSEIRQGLIDRIGYGLMEGETMESRLGYLELEADKLMDQPGEMKKKQMNLVQLRKEQYVFLDSLSGTQPLIFGQASKARYWVGDQVSMTIKPFDSISLAWNHLTREDFEDPHLHGLTESGDFSTSGLVFDFRDPEQVRSLINSYAEVEELANGAKRIEWREQFATLLYYLDYYAEKCNFNPTLLLIYEERKKGTPYSIIQKRLKDELNVEHRRNYLSTIFTKQILKAISERAEEHELIVRLMVTEGVSAFKECSRCKELKPRDPLFFMRRKSSKDGFVNYCKACR